jgi:hypothetical protein
VSKLTVIEGGGPRDPHEGPARYHFQRLICEILRGLARGDDLGQRVQTEMLAFQEHSAAVETALLSRIISDVLRDLHKELIWEDVTDDYIVEHQAIIQTALRVAAETVADDSFAKARCQDREHELRRDIDQYIVGRERRSRESGWSFLTKLIKEHFPPQRKSPRSKPPRRTAARLKGSKRGAPTAPLLPPKPEPEGSKE